MRAQLKLVEAERDRLLAELAAMQDDVREHGREIASLERLNEHQRVSALHSAETLRETADTVVRQAGEMSDQLEVLAELKSEHVASARLASRLQKATARTVNQQAGAIADQVDVLSGMTEALDESIEHVERLEVDVVRRTLQVREKEELLALVLNVSVDGVLVYRALQDEADDIHDFECVLHNPAATKIYGVEGLEGKRLLELHPDVHTKGLLESYIQVMRTGNPYEGEYSYDVAGRERWFRVLVVKMDDGIAIMFSDISERKRLEAKIHMQLDELQTADLQKIQFLSVMSHELRTPLNAIMGFTSILEDELPGPLNESQRHFLVKILASSDHMLALVDDLLDMSRIHAGKLRVDPEACDFLATVEEILQQLAPRLETRTFRSVLPMSMPPMLAESGRVGQVLRCLLDNAIKFTADSGTITLRADTTPDGFLRCEVEDDGCGVGPEDIHKLFQLFVQLDMSNTRKAGGTGLGLTISKNLIEAHGGAMGVESLKDQGSTFWFTIPLAPAS